MENLILPAISDYESEIEKIRAAYALNVCAVSVSQIVDYNDQYILDQEYENTLNNLNLERMPKDEAFLKILTETLNVVTFFRIYSSKKKMIEEKYQHKIKNAIWSAVPNLAFIISSGGMGGIPALVASLATEVGLGYMNYRKTKAENDLEYRSNMVELEYTAIEQLNAIRTELFVTSWKIAEKYEFPDNYRLTENQINQFNDILMDPNLMRRFSRLFSIRQNFIAYPPFWYYLGNAANLIYQKDSTNYSEEYKAYYKGIAEQAYDYYIKLNESFSVLRSDEIVSACALEYCDLLPEEAADKKAELLKIAFKWAGGRNDVVQLCAFAYLKMERFIEAESLLKKLVDERYNEDLNAQVLSSIYANYYFKTSDANTALSHTILSQQVPSTVLFPLPVKDNEAKSQSELWDIYMVEQKSSLSAGSKKKIDDYLEGFNYRLNKMLMNFDSTMTYPDSMFLSDGVEARNNEAQRVFARPLIVSDYINNLQGIDYPITLVDTLNEMLNGLRYIPFLKMEKCVQILEEKVGSCSETIEQLQECINTRNITYDTYLSVFEKITFTDITKEFSDEIKSQLDSYIDMFSNMKDIILMEMIMGDFVEKNNIKVFEKDSFDALETKKNWFMIDASIVGKTAISVKNEKDNRQKLEELIRSKISHLILDSNKVKVYFPGDIEFDNYFGNTVNIISTRITKENLKNQTIAIIDDVTAVSFDLLFTYNSVVPCFTHKLWPSIEYKYVKYDEFKGQLIVGGILYKSPYIDMLKLARCVEDLARAKETMDEATSTESTEEKSVTTEAPASKIQMIKKCNQCGKFSREDATNCSDCGSEDLITIPNLKGIVFCPSCGRQVQPEAQFCGRCGAKI